MPNIKSAKKRMELSRSAREKNRAERQRIRTAMKNVRKADSADQAQELLAKAYALLDRAATKDLFPSNRVARYKSQLAAHVKTLEA